MTTNKVEIKTKYREVSDYLKGYSGNATLGCYERRDGTKGWYVKGIKSRSILLALIQMSQDPTVKNKPFTQIPRRKKPVSIEDIKAEQWWGVLKWNADSDRPWVYSGDYTSDRSEGDGQPKDVAFLEIPRKRAYTAKDATEQKVKHNPKLDRTLQIKRDLETLANQVETIGTLGEIETSLRTALAQLDGYLM